MSTHFDTIAGEYDDSLPPHVVEHYLRKRTRFVAEQHASRNSLGSIVLKPRRGSGHSRMRTRNSKAWRGSVREPGMRRLTICAAI